MSKTARILSVWQHHAVFLLLGIVWFPSVAIAQQATTVSNTASGSFGDPLDPDRPPREALSNEVPLQASLGEAVLELIKTGDRAAAAPGDTVIYRLLVRNTGTAAIRDLSVSDRLPLGMQLIENSVQAALTSGSTTLPADIALDYAASVPVNLPAASQTDRNATFSYPAVLDPGQDLLIVYALLVTPDALRGSGKNLAQAAGRTPTQTIGSSTASHQLRIKPGILSDCGTLIGRVFEDLNFDGEQQLNEPGIPNAVVFLDDGNRVLTDVDGLFSLTCALPGRRTGRLDLSSIPGYRLAPNQIRIQDNSPSRWVQMAPGSLERMNFSVIFVGSEEQE